MMSNLDPEITHERSASSVRVREEVKLSKFTHELALGHCILSVFPPQLFTDESFLKLRRLDLSYNAISVIPTAVGELVNLTELWLQHNPIKEVPVELQNLSKLEVLDIRNTKVLSIPSEIGNLQKLYEIDWRCTPLEKSLNTEFGIGTNDINKLRLLLRSIYHREQLEYQLRELLAGEHFIMDIELPDIQVRIKELVKAISNTFNDELTGLVDFKSYCRIARKLLPDRIHLLRPNSVEKSKDLFYQMKRDTDRQRMAADVEIKLRGMYFDMIDRSRVTEILDSIYAHVATLEDIQFLVQYAPQVLPQNPDKASAERIWSNIIDLQSELFKKREAAIASLGSALTQLYPEQRPEEISRRAREIAQYFQLERFATKKELVKMSQLTAECTKVFPPDYPSLDPEEVIDKANEIIFKRQ